MRVAIIVLAVALLGGAQVSSELASSDTMTS